MDSARWSRARALFRVASERRQQSWPQLLEQACLGDGVLRDEVLSLLECHRDAGTFLDDPVLGLSHDETGTLEGAPADPMAGRRCGPYRIVHHLGGGGMGAVYLAVRADGAYHKQVALKMLRPDLARPELIRRFCVERQLLAALDHPYIVKLLDGGLLEEGLPYYVMEYVEGQPIDLHCEALQYTTSARLALFQRVCEAVGHAHRNLMVHCDLKPQNILVTADGTPKLLDFGIARLLNPDLAAETWAPIHPQQRLMTPEYASPEQVLGRPVTVASDVYSLGVLLYKLLTDHLPYEIENRAPDAVAQVVCGAHPEKLSAVAERRTALATTAARPKTRLSRWARVAGGRVNLRRQLAGDLDSIVLKAMHKEPAQRYGSAVALAADLACHLADRPVLARRPTWRYRMVKLLRRHRHHPLALAAAALAVAFLVWSWRSFLPPPS